MATVYNNGSGGQSMGNMDAQMAAAKEAYMKAQLEGNPEAGKVAGENYYKAEEFKKEKEKSSKVTKDMIDRADKAGQEKANQTIKTQQEEAKQRVKTQEIPKLQAYDSTVGKNPGHKITNDLLAEYGNNYFELITFDNGLNENKNNGQLVLAGVLKELPSFSMAADWEAGPAATVSDTVKNLMCSPLVEMTNTLGGRDRAWMNLDEGTDRTYKSTQRPGFELNFKLYTNETIGTQRLTDYKTWIKALALYTMPSVDAKVSITGMANNLVNGVLNTVDLVADVLSEGANVFKSAMSDETDKSISDADFVKPFTDALQAAGNKAADIVASRDDENRVLSNINKKNLYGAKLWYLNILPGIFKKPLIVYIENWGVTYSKEINPLTHLPISIEFKISCKMDQVASVPVWMQYLTGSKNAFPYKKD
jgi:hypothetical protein